MITNGKSKNFWKVAWSKIVRICMKVVPILFLPLCIRKTYLWPSSFRFTNRPNFINLGYRRGGSLPLPLASSVHAFVYILSFQRGVDFLTREGKYYRGKFLEQVWTLLLHIYYYIYVVYEIFSSFVFSSLPVFGKHLTLTKQNVQCTK